MFCPPYWNFSLKILLRRITRNYRHNCQLSASRSSSPSKQASKHTLSANSAQRTAVFHANDKPAVPGIPPSHVTLSWPGDVYSLEDSQFPSSSSCVHIVNLSCVVKTAFTKSPGRQSPPYNSNGYWIGVKLIAGTQIVVNLLIAENQLIAGNQIAGNQEIEGNQWTGGNKWIVGNRVTEGNQWTDRDPAFRDRRDPFDRFPPRFAEGPPRGPPFDFDQPPPGWDRGRGRGGRGMVRGGPGAPWGPADRGRFDGRNSRRSDWEGRNRPDNFFGPDRRDFPDRRDGDRRDADRRDDRRDASKDDRDKRVDDKRPEDRDRKDDGKDRDDSRKKDEAGKDDKNRDAETKDRKKDDRTRDVEGTDRKRDDSRRDVDVDRRRDDRSRDAEGPDKRKDDRSKDREDRKRDDDRLSERDPSRKRPASAERAVPSPVPKRPRDGSPALSQHSHKSSKKGSEKTGEVETERKRSRSRSRDGSRSGDSKRRKLDGEEAEKPAASDEESGLKVDIVGRVDSMIDQNFSDWSDNDSDDDILNQPGEVPPTQEAGDDRQRRSPSRSSVGSKHSQKSGKDRPEGDVEKSKKTKSQDGEEVDEFESISSEEGSLLGTVKPAAVDALEIDWASLVRDERPKLSTTSALQRFTPGCLFAKMGVSRDYAGEALYNEVVAVCQRHLDETEGGNEGESETVKTETSENTESETGETDPQVQSEVADSQANTEAAEPSETVEKPERTKFQFHHDVAMFHSSALSKLKERRTLLGDIGPFRRALCARRDLEMRRQLCKVDKLLDSSHLYPNQELDSDLYKHSIKVFKTARNRGVPPTVTTQVAVQ